MKPVINVQHKKMEVVSSSGIDYSKYLAKKRNCVICGKQDFQLWVKSGVFDVVRCDGCGLIFVNPCLNEKGLKIVYEGHHKGRVTNTEECIKRAVMYKIDRDFLLEVIDKGKILDVGCGGGFFLDKFDPAKWEKSGIEIDEDAVRHAREHFGLPNVRVWDSAKMPFVDAEFDVVVFRGSLEHIADPRPAVEEAKRMLKRNGYLYICATPNVDSFCADIYKDKWNQFDAKEHIFMFSLKTLKKLIEPMGFRAVKTTAPYEETPYCDIENDMRKVLADYQLYKEGKHGEMGISPAFWGNMLSIIFRKQGR